MAVIDFKHVGVKSFSKEVVAARNQTLVPIGIKTPMELGSDTFLTMNFSAIDQVEDNLRNLLQTNYGDRVMLYDFGANLKPLVMEWTSKADFDSEAMVRINTAITKWMPFVTPVGFESFPQVRNGAPVPVVNILLLWAVPSLKTETRALELVLGVS